MSFPSELNRPSTPSGHSEMVSFRSIQDAFELLSVQNEATLSQTEKTTAAFFSFFTSMQKQMEEQSAEKALLHSQIDGLATRHNESITAYEAKIKAAESENEALKQTLELIKNRLAKLEEGQSKLEDRQSKFENLLDRIIKFINELSTGLASVVVTKGNFGDYTNIRFWGGQQFQKVPPVK